jgi:HNH endonuclease
MPIQYAGPGHWSVFEKPLPYARLDGRVVAVPGTEAKDICVVITAELWQTFQSMSIWIEALCVHEWSLFTERMAAAQAVTRGDVYTLLTARPDNRRPLTWESNQVDILLLEGEAFICPWTAKRIVQGVKYDLDHLLPIAIYPVNELWNLIPADPYFNRHKKCDKLPSTERLQAARPHLEWDYGQYGRSVGLAKALREDARLRFATLGRIERSGFAGAVADVVVDLIEQVAQSRNLSRFG